MGSISPFEWSLLLLFGAGAGFIGSGLGVIIATYRRPSARSGWNTLLVSVAMGIGIIFVAWYKANV